MSRSRRRGLTPEPLKRDASLWLRVADEAERLFGVRPDDQALERVEAYATLILEWSGRLNLVSFRTQEELLFRHFLDSLAPLSLLEGRKLRVADVGSGAGLPGVPLAVARPGLEMILVESRRRRAAFLRHVIRTLGLDDVEVEEGRSEEIAGRWHQRLDVVVGRAIRPEIVTEFAASTLCHGGSLILMGKASTPAVVSAGFELGPENRYELPGGELHLVRRFDRR